MKFRKILKKYVLNNAGYKILALCFAFIMWLVVLNITDPDYTKTISNIKVNVINEDKILDGTHVYTISSGEATSITVTGKKSIVSNLSLNDFVVTADLAQLSITNAAPITAQLTGDKLKYSDKVTITPKDTSMIINLEDMTSRYINVELEYRGELADNIVIDEANISPKKVTISAPESITNSAEKAVITANYRDINSDTTLYLSPTIKNVNGTTIKEEGDVSLDEDRIVVEFKVSYKKSVPIRTSVTGEAAEGYQFDGLELSQDTITVKGSETDTKTLYRIIIPPEELNIDGLTESFTKTIDVTPYLPENISVYGESPTVDVTVNISKVDSGVEESAPEYDENNPETGTENDETEAADETLENELENSSTEINE